MSEYLEDGTRTTSLKCDLQAAVPREPCWRGPSSTGAHIARALTGLLPPTLQKHAPHRAIVDALLSALVTFVRTADDPTVDDLRHLPAAERARTTVLSCDRWPLSLTDIAHRVGLSPSRISHLFRDEYGITLKAFIDTTRADIAAQHLHYSTMSIKEVAEATGFDSLHSFSRFFRRVQGVSPRGFRHQRVL